MPRYIDADALVAELQKKPIHDGHFIHTRDVSDAIFYAPTISPDEVRGVGKWLERVDYDWDIYHECSVCHTPFTMLDGTTPELNDYHYCPNCGAKMKGAEDGTIHQT